MTTPKKPAAKPKKPQGAGVPMKEAASPDVVFHGPEDAYGTDPLRGDYTGRTGDPKQAHYEGDRKQA